MSQDIWTAIVAARYAANVLWSPALTFDLMANDWANLWIPSHVSLNESVSTAADTDFKDLATLTFEIPDDMDADTTHSDLFFRIVVNADVRTIPDTFDDGEIQFKTESHVRDVSPVQVIDQNWDEYTLWAEVNYPASATPRLVQATLEARRTVASGPTSVEILRNQLHLPATGILARYP